MTFRRLTALALVIFTVCSMFSSCAEKAKTEITEPDDTENIETTGIVSGVLDTTDLAGEEDPFIERDYYLSCEGMFEYSADHNVLVFVLDRLDYDYIAALRPEFFDKLDGFTSYTNTITSYARTRPALSHLLTAYEDCVYDLGNDYYKDAWTANGKHLLRDLRTAGYRVDVYAEMYTMFSDDRFAYEHVDNVDYKRTDEDASGEDIAPANDVYVVDEALYIEGFEQIGLAEKLTDNADVTKCFKFYHFNGVHSPFYLNEDGTRSTEGTTNNVQQTKGTFSILYRIFDRMKELGIYEDSAIIITADHGCAISDTDPLLKATRVGLFYKPSGSAGTPLAESNAPISTFNINATIMKEAGADYAPYGRAIDEIAEDEDIVRTYYKTSVGDPNYVYEYEVTGDASDFANWVMVDSRELPDGVY